jgi:CheY-like chemotaxis protein
VVSALREEIGQTKTGNSRLFHHNFLSQRRRLGVEFHRVWLFVAATSRHIANILPFRLVHREGGKRTGGFRGHRELGRSFMDDLSGLAWVTDAQGHCRILNRRATTTFGLTQTKWFKKSETEVLPAPFAAAGEDRRAISVCERATSQIVGLHDNERPRCFLLNRFPLRVANETMIGAVAFELTDCIIPARNAVAAREELFGYERAHLIEGVSSSLAHNLNNTLNAIRLRLSLLRNDRIAGTETLGLDWLSQQLDKAAASVQRLQESSRVEWDRPLIKLDISAIIVEAISAAETCRRGDFARTRTDSRFYLEEVPSEVSPIMGVAPELFHLFVNLFLDADRVMPPEASLRITLKEDGRRVTVTLLAQDKCFSRGAWAGLLNPFSNPEDKRPIDPRFSMTASLMVRLGGTVEIIRITGTTDDFGLKLGFPLADSYALVPPKAPRKRKACRSLLVIDDDRDNLEQMKSVLELRGFSVLTASSGFEALRMLHANRAVDSVVCDLGMPGMNGWDVASELARSSPETPVYLVTGWADTIPLLDARRNLVEAVLNKPINLEQLEKLLLSAKSN